MLEVYNVVEQVTPSDTVDLKLTDGIWVGGTGNLHVMLQNGQTRVFGGVPAGILVPVRAKRVMLAGTTATLILAMYQV
jgi:hypothetical protein